MIACLTVGGGLVLLGAFFAEIERGLQKDFQPGFWYGPLLIWLELFGVALLVRGIHSL